ncbi:peroxidase 56-like [Silene latifolia]|uniref:peroxidase 56-like n=1 Tax=Silene latifolia TaxID=37657 RepID=UPI003D77FC53
MDRRTFKVCAHTIGDGHCFIIQNRLYNFTGKGDTDPAIEKSYADYLKTKCPPNTGNLQSSVGMDFFTPGKFDEVYYGMVTQRKGLFQSDAALLNDPETSFYVHFQAYTGGSTFAQDFGAAMTRLIQIGVLTDNEGEVRKTCGAVRYNY